MTAQTAPKPHAVPPIRVLIVDDSAVVRGMTARWLGAEEGLEVAGLAHDGEHCVKEAERLQPDVIVLDVEMPRLSGLEALPKLRAVAPGARVVMASTLTRRGGETTIKALAAGAADYIAKPETSGLGGAEAYRRDLVLKIRGLGHARRRAATPISAEAALRAPALPPLAPTPQASVALATHRAKRPDLLVVGSSTGGPQALQVFLSGLLGSPARRPSLPILIVQHMPPTFTAILAEHIANVLKIDCREARNNDPVRAGEILIAPGDFHMRVARTTSGLCVRLDQGAAVSYCRPAVDPLFESAAEVTDGRVLGVVLTGMGADGRDGSRRVVQLGGRVLVQDEASSVVWGMPGAVAKAGLASAIEPLDRIGFVTQKAIEGSQP
jgi:two-component system chemotaxis response regulator CheB